jgi:hypothetical protein
VLSIARRHRVRFARHQRLDAAAHLPLPRGCLGNETTLTQCLGVMLDAELADVAAREWVRTAVLGQSDAAADPKPTTRH